VNEGVRRATCPDNKLRASIVEDRNRAQEHSGQHPAVTSMELVPGKPSKSTCAKGGGSEAKSKFAMLNPSDSVVDWVLKTCHMAPAGARRDARIGIGGTAEKAMQMAKKS